MLSVGKQQQEAAKDLKSINKYTHEPCDNTGAKIEQEIVQRAFFCM